MKKILSAICFSILFISNINAIASKNITVHKNIIIVGLKITTNAENVAKDTMALWQDFLTEKLDSKIPHRSNKNKYVVTSNFKDGNFDIIIGVPVNVIDTKNLNPKLSVITIKEGKYRNFKTPSGSFPQNLQETWAKIYADKELAKVRKYTTDYEVYTPKAISNLNKAEIDVFISVNK